MRATVRTVVALSMAFALFVPLAATVAAAGISVSPSSGAIGTTTTVTGSGFAANTTVRIFVGGPDGELVGAESSDASGNLPSLNVVIPDLVGGAYDVFATDGTNTATTTFTVPSGLTLSPASGAPGTTVSVSATGFLMGEGVVIGWDVGNNQLTTANANPNGGFTASVTVPTTSANGTHQIVVSGQSSEFTLFAAFTVSGGSNAGATLSVSPASGPRGSAVTLTGTGFGPSEQINIAVDGGAVTSTTSDASGNFTASISVASSLANGAHTLSATGGTSGRSASATFVVTPSGRRQPPCTDNNQRRGFERGDDNQCPHRERGHQGDDDDRGQGDHNNHQGGGEHEDSD